MMSLQGADDNLIKVFNVNLGLLKFTYRLVLIFFTFYY